jgi:hypothetical protein
LLGGWLGEHYGLRSALVFAGIGALLLAVYGWRQVTLRSLRRLPPPDDAGPQRGGEAMAWATEAR